MADEKKPKKRRKTAEEKADEALAAEYAADEQAIEKKQARLTPFNRAKRNAAIVHDRIVDGLTWPAIAEKHKLTPRACQIIFRLWRESEKLVLSELDAVAEIAEMVTRYDALMESAVEIREMARGQKNLNAMVGANRQYESALTKKAELLQSSNLLPKNLGSLKFEFDLRYFAEVVVRVFHKHNVPMEAQEEIMGVLRERVRLSSGKQTG